MKKRSGPGSRCGAQHFFGVSARGLTREQSARLAAVLPNPKGWILA